MGKIVDLNCFPVKSCGPIKQNSFTCHPLGLEIGSFYDRSFIVVTQNKKQATARGYPKMVLIHPTINGDRLILSAPGKQDILIDLNDLKDKKTTKVATWRDNVVAIDAGDEVAEWISEFVTDKKDFFRLMYYPLSYATKGIQEYKLYKQLKSVDAGAYHDATSYMLINQASIDELNTHLDHVVKPLQFRPNLVIKGPAAYEEDNWKWIRIGEEIVFRNVKPCTRYFFLSYWL